MQRDWVCVGDSTGTLHLLDLKKNFEPVKSYFTKHIISGISQMHMTNGCLITAGYRDPIVRFSSLTDPPQTIATIDFEFRNIRKVSVTRIYRKKNDFDEIFKNLARSKSKKIIYHKNKEKTILLKYLKI